jgi:hypothetical protein
VGIGRAAHGLDPLMTGGEIHGELVQGRHLRALEVIGELPEHRRRATLLKIRRLLIVIDFARCGEGVDVVRPLLLTSLSAGRERQQNASSPVLHSFSWLQCHAPQTRS